MTLQPFLHAFSPPRRTEYIPLVSGSGSTVVDRDGNRYLDAIASLWCVNVGHGRDEVIEAVGEQMRALATYNTFPPWTNEPADQLAEMIAARAPMDDARVFFTNSGSEAVDTVMKLARFAHVLEGDDERTMIVSREGGYHGTAYGGTSAQGIEPNRVGYGPLVPDVVQVGRHDIEAMAGLFAERGAQIAGVITEPIQGASGVYTPEPGYLEALRRLCDQHGALLIFDEVITGFGRLGTWFAAERYGVEPDLITFAKAVTSGYVPMGGVLIGPKVNAALDADPDTIVRTGFTYSGHPTAAAAGIACIEVTETAGLLERAVELGRRIGPGLEAMRADGLVTEVRGEGAIWGFDIAIERGGSTAIEIRDALLSQGVIVRPIGETTLAMCPPLVMTDSETDQLLDRIERALADR